MVNLFVRFSLVFDIFFDRCFICVSPNCIHIISTRLDISSPQITFYFRMALINFLRRNAFHCLDHLLRRLHRNSLNQKMHMVLIGPNLYEFHLVTLSYFCANPFQCFNNLFVEYFSTIFCRAHKMIKQYALIVAFDYCFAHAWNLPISALRLPRPVTPMQSIGEFCSIKDAHI